MELTWHDVYGLFDDIVTEYFPDADRIESEVQKLCAEHEGDPAYDEAYERWTEWGIDEGMDIEDSPIVEMYDDDAFNVYTVTIEELREGSIGNMDDDDIDYQEKLFKNIVRKLKADETDIVGMKFDEGYYDYNPEYISEMVEIYPDRYGDVCKIDDLTFYKEADNPFLFFKSEDDLHNYIAEYVEAME